jgi:transcriptional regulator with XRE-family HTH domain
VTPRTRRQELAAFLRSRRQRIDPNDHGFDHGRRRAPGLRREEVAALAGLSLSWYTWLEQARDVHPSRQVLASIGRALLLDEAELEYLLRLGGHAPTETPRSDRDDPQLQALTESFLPNPASIITPSYDYVAWNRASEQIVPGFLGCGDGRYNLMRFVFGGAAERNPVEGPKDGPWPLVAQLRTNAARHPDDPAIDALVEELSDTSAEFARMWRLQEVAPAGPPHDVPLGHPDVGVLNFKQIHLRPEHHPDLTLVLFLPADEATAAGLGRLAAPQ